MALNRRVSKTMFAAAAWSLVVVGVPGCDSKTETRSVRSRAASSESSKAPDGELVRAVTQLFTA
ncbi:MAG: hypothetical protein WBD02_02375, partial [Acidimicrobiia bacterium]